MPDHAHPHSPGDAHAVLHGHAHDEAVERAVEVLRARGERVTAPRLAVLELLAHSSAHLSAEQVAAALEGVHRATAYRTLERFTELGIVTQAHTASDASAYHLAVTPAGHDHLHGRCRSCGRIVVLPPDALDAATAALQRAGLFTLEAQASELVGLCPDCAAA